MKSDYTHLSVILDRTGSMDSIRDDTIGGFNAFLEAQKALPGTATLTLVQFDSQDPYEVIHDFRPLWEVPALRRSTFVPRAATPLLDALGRGINDLDQRLGQLCEDAKPARVVLVVITDGEENASREFSRAQIQQMINHKQEHSGWQILFLSADLGAIQEALDRGVCESRVLAFDKNAEGVREAWASSSRNISDYRMCQSASIAFSDEDRARQTLEKARG